MIQIPIHDSDINILFLRDVQQLLLGENVELLVVEEVDSTYSISKIPPFYQGYINDLYNRLAYHYDSLSSEYQIQYQNQYKHMKRNANGTYYADVKTYFLKNQKPED